MVTSGPRTRSTSTSTVLQEKARQARQFISNLWTARRKELTSSYQNLTEDTNTHQLEDKPSNSDPGRDISCDSVTDFVPNVCGFAALDLRDATGSTEVENNNATQESVELCTRRSYYYDSNKIESESGTTGGIGANSSVTQSNPKHQVPQWFDDKDWRLYYGKEKKKKKKKRKVVFHLDTEQKTIEQESYVQLEEENDDKEDKKKRKGKKKKKVISTKAKKKAKRAGTVAWKGIKISWKYFKYGLIAMTEGPGSAFSTPQLMKAYMGTSPQKTTVYKDYKR